ncbi:hypothetical protein BGZ96_009106 [Linnemannia gamsii]|uniref:Uncharacterized protein n=1 Tax=Linnemannia gamsii TaxID=64522 RepID=A0ABQ7JXU8_9FUNG|nr:hypothetical protein BGZ96_009106 [Linnemannia gamsii]
MFDWLSRRRARATSMPPPTTTAYSRIDPDNESTDTPTLHGRRRTHPQVSTSFHAGIQAKINIVFVNLLDSVGTIINNLIYVVILSAAVDLVGAKVPKQRPRASSWDPSTAYLSPQLMKPTSTPPLQSKNGLMDGAGAPHVVQQQQDRNGSGGSNTQSEGSTLPTSSGRTSPPSTALTADNSSTSSSSYQPIPPVIPSWDITAPSWEAPQHRTEPTSINTLLAATNPHDPNFVSPFRESEESGPISTSGRRRRVYKSQPDENMTMQEKRAMARSLLVPFMFPLFMVYFA